MRNLRSGSGGSVRYPLLLDRAHSTSVIGTTGTQVMVADVFVGRNNSVTYLAYDRNGTGISAIITLDCVSASQYKTANGLV